MKRIFITGGNGFVASNIIAQWHDKYQVYATVRDKSRVDDLIHFEEIDLTEEGEMLYFLKDAKPDVVIHAAAISSDRRCNEDVRLATFVNVESTKYLANYVNRLQSQFIFLSTDLVFQGDRPPYAEADKVSPKMTYGRLKTQAENQIKGMDCHLILRLPLMYGQGKYDRKGILNGLVSDLKNQKPVNLFYDEYRTPLYTNDLVDGLDLLINHDCRGTYHIAGNERLSRYDFGVKIAEVFDLDKDLCLKKSQRDLNLDKFRPKDVSLNIDKINKLGYSASSVFENLDRLASEINIV